MAIEGIETRYQIAQCWDEHAEALHIFHEFLRV